MRFAMPKKKGGLGRGLDVFFGDDDYPGILEDDRSAKFIEVPITEVRAVAINRARRWMKRL